MLNAEQPFLIVSDGLDPAIQNLTKLFDAKNPIAHFRFKDIGLSDAISQSQLGYTVVDLSETDEYVLGVIGRLQAVGSTLPIICLSSRGPVHHPVLSRDGSFLFLHPQLKLEAFPHFSPRPLSPSRICFRGEFQAESLLEAVQLLLVSGVSGRLVVWRRWSRGELWLHEGHIVHAEAGERRGRDAVKSMFEWLRGTFRLQIGRAPTFSLRIGLSDPLLALLPQTCSTREDQAGCAEEGPASEAAQVPRASSDAIVEAPIANAIAPCDQVDQSEQSLAQGWLQIEATKDAEEIENAEADKASQPTLTNRIVNETLSKLAQNVDGFLGAAVADSDSGVCLGLAGGSEQLNMELAAAGNTEVMRAKRKIVKSLDLQDEIDDVLISLGMQYHLIRPVRSRPSLFICLAVDRSRANLAMARFALTESERELGI